MRLAILFLDIRTKYVLTKKSEAYVLTFPDAGITIGLIMLLAQARAMRMSLLIARESFISYTRDSPKYKEQMLKIQYQLHEKDAYVSISQTVSILMKRTTLFSLRIIPLHRKTDKMGIEFFYAI